MIIVIINNNNAKNQETFFGLQRDLFQYTLLQKVAGTFKQAIKVYNKRLQREL